MRATGRYGNPKPLVIERLDKKVHDRGDFDCGESSLNDYLKFTARQHMDKGYVQVWVAVSEPGAPQIIGYYTLSTSALEPEQLPGKSAINKVPVVLLGRLAVDSRYKVRRSACGFYSTRRGARCYCRRGSASMRSS